MANFKLITANPRQPLQQKKQTKIVILASTHYIPYKLCCKLFRKAAFFCVFFHIFSNDLFPQRVRRSGSPACRQQQALLRLLPAASLDRAWPTAAVRTHCPMGREGNSSFYHIGTHGETFHFIGVISYNPYIGG